MSATVIMLIILVFVLGLGAGGALIWLLSRRSKPPVAAPSVPAAAVTQLNFSFAYVALPLAIAVISIITLLLLYPSLSPTLAYRFNASGTPRGVMGRELFMLIMLGAQLAITAAAAVIAWSIIGIGRRMLKAQALPTNPSRLIWLMANMIVLPQIIMAFIGIDAAFYDRTARHMVSPWAFTLLTIAVGTAVIIILFVLSARQSRTGT